MSEKNLTKERSKHRWRLAYQAMALVAVSGLYPLTVHALNHPLLGSNPALLQLERWNLPFLKSTANATAGWLALFLLGMMARTVWNIYGLMGVHLKKPPRHNRCPGKPPSKRARRPIKEKTTSRS